MGDHDFAALTIVRDEPLFLRVWLNYYANVFPHEDVYVIDNGGKDDTSVQEAKLLFPRVNFLPHEVTSQTHMTLTLKSLVEKEQAKLLQRYKAVVFAEADEFLIPSQSYHDLREYCDHFMASTRKWIRASGWNVVQQPNEAPVAKTPGAQLLADRHMMWRLPMYDKTLVTKVSLDYQKGFHNFFIGKHKQVNEPVDPELFLLHAWCIDVDEYYRRHSARLGFTDRNQVVDLFANITEKKNSFGDPYAVGQAQQVPETWRPLLTY